LHSSLTQSSYDASEAEDAQLETGTRKKLLTRLIAAHLDLERCLLRAAKSRRDRAIIRAAVAQGRAERDEEIATLKRML
jgi:hypothetical protein